MQKREDNHLPSSQTALSSPTLSVCSESESEVTAWGLSKELKWRLILDIEKRGGLRHCKLFRLCDEIPHLYGHPNSKLCQQVSNKVSKWRRLSAPAFLEERNNIFSGTNSKGKEETSSPAPTTPAPTTPAPTPVARKERTETPSRIFPFHATSKLSLSLQKLSIMNVPWADYRFGPSKSVCLL